MTSSPDPKKTSREFSRIGQVLSERYRLESLLGKGGMAVVYKALHLETQQIVAVKMILPDVQDDDEMLSRFHREAKSASKVSHENIIGLIDYGRSTDGLLYLVFEFVDGQTLAELLEDEGQLAVQRAVPIFAQICDAMSAAHAKNLVHRDLKPSNIMIMNQSSDKVKIVDFGLAKLTHGSANQALTQTGEVLGSPVYMSPEQCRGLQLDQRSDIYSLGILMYETLIGKVPFRGNNVVMTINQQMHSQPQPFKDARADLVIQPAVEAIIRKALAKNPEQRYQSMLEVKSALIEAVPLPVPKPKTSSIPEALSGIPPTVIIAAFLFVIGVIAATMAFWPKSADRPGAPAVEGSQAPASSGVQ